MSSKSRKQSPKAGKKSRSTGPAFPAEGAGKPQEEQHGLVDIPDDVLHAPKETSKLRFALMILLIIFLLIIFIVPASFQNLGRSAARGETPVLEWERTAAGSEIVYGSQLALFHQALDDADRVTGGFLLPSMMSFEDDRRVSVRDAARILLLSRIAEDAGIRVPDADLGQFLKGTVVAIFHQGDVESYKQSIASMRTDVEETFRRCLMVNRLQQLLGYGGALPHPDEILEQWNEAHLEVAYHYGRVASADFLDAARTELPSEEDLEAWFDARPEAEKLPFKTPEKRTVEVVVFRDAETTPATGLLEAYPEPEDAVAEDRAQEYYNRVYFRRFTEELPEDAAPGAIPNFRPFEDVQEIALAEAPVYFAMNAWLEDIRARLETGEEVDFVAEAEAHGLDVIRLEEVTRDELEAHEELGDLQMVNTVFSTSVDEYSFAPTWVKAVGGFARTVERVEAALPPFDAIRGQVADDWVEPRASALALEHLRGVWESFEAFTPETVDRFQPRNKVHRRATADEFRAAVDEAGLTFGERDYLDRGGSADDDPNRDEPANAFLWSRNFVYGNLETDEVAAPELDADEEFAYLVRLADKREVPITRMSPREYADMKDRGRRAALGALRTDLDLEFLRAEFGLVELQEGLLSERGEDEEDGAEEGGAADEAPVSEG